MPSIDDIAILCLALDRGVIKPVKEGKLQVCGYTFDNKAEACRAFGVRYGTVCSYAKKYPKLGFEYSVKRFLESVGGLGTDDVPVYGFEKIHSSVFEACRTLGLCKSRVLSKIRYLHLTFEESCLLVAVNQGRQLNA